VPAIEHDCFVVLPRRRDYQYSAVGHCDNLFKAAAFARSWAPCTIALNKGSKMGGRPRISTQQVNSVCDTLQPQKQRDTDQSDINMLDAGREEKPSLDKEVIMAKALRSWKGFP
jgi:hypothetical protein